MPAVDTKPDGTPASSAFDTLALGALGSCGIAGGIIHCWGGSMGQASPWQGHTVPGGVGVRSVSVGFEHACGQREPTTIICWGERDLGALGIGDDGARGVGLKRWMDRGSFISGFAKGPPVVGGHLVDDATGREWRATNREPRRVLSDARFTLIAAGVDHTCGATDRNEVLCWGRTTRGATGATDRPTQEKPKAVTFDQR